MALVPLALDRHPENVGGALKEREIILDELIARSAVDLENPERPTIALQDNVHGATNAMSDENLGRSETLLDFEMIGDHWSAGLQCKSGRRSEIRVDFGDADDAWVPTHAGPNQKSVLGRNIFEHFAKLGSKALGGQARRIRKKLLEPRPLQCADAELRQDLLLPNALVQGA
jgi:hypothetical protein